MKPVTVRAQCGEDINLRNLEARNALEEEFIVADIKITNEAGVTKHFYEVDSQLGAILCFAGIARPIVKTAPPPILNAWSVGHPPYGTPDVWIIVWAADDGSRMYFQGAPDAYLKNPPVYGGTSCPIGVVEQYKRLREAPVPFMGVTEADRSADAARQQREKELTHRFSH